MTTMNRILGAALVALLALSAAPAAAQAPVDLLELPLISDYDLDSTSTIYCRTLGRNNDVAPDSWRIPASTLNTAVTASGTLTMTSGSPFTGLSVGDEIVIRSKDDVIAAGALTEVKGKNQRAYVTTVTSVNAIVVSPAVTFTVGSSFVWRKRECGTGATNGWFPVRGWGAFTVQVQIDQQNTTTGIDVSLWCRVNGSASVGGVDVYEATTYTTTDTFAIRVYGPWDECRLGLDLTSTDDGGDLTTNAEKISAYVTGRR